MNAKEYAVKANGTFILPDVCFKIRNLMEDDSSSIEDFANVISIDPSMTSRLLKLANSSIYNFRSEVSTVSRAISLIGTQAIYNMVLVDVAATAFSHFSTESIDLKRFWRESIVTGLACKNLTIASGMRDIERLFVVGLLHNFGELIVAKLTPEIAKKCAQYHQTDLLPWELQKQQLGFTYTDISVEMLSLWQIPEKIIMPIRHYNQAKTIQINKDVKVLYLASRLALIDSSPDDYNYDMSADEDICQSLNIDENDLHTASEFACKEADNIASIMNANFY